VLGCDECSKELATAATADDNCFTYCKTLNYGGLAIRKGVIEPDKACLIGCVINTCQQVCTGGTTDTSITVDNAQYWWNNGGNGCSIKSGGGYVQNPDYGNPNGPSGPGASDDQKACCSNAFNLCYYVGNKQSTNYANVIYVTNKACAKVGVPADITATCNWYNDQANCGSQGMRGTKAPTS
jgi:hypothetical protein